MVVEKVVLDIRPEILDGNKRGRADSERVMVRIPAEKDSGKVYTST